MLRLDADSMLSVGSSMQTYCHILDVRAQRNDRRQQEPKQWQLRKLVGLHQWLELLESQPSHRT